VAISCPHCGIQLLDSSSVETIDCHKCDGRIRLTAVAVSLPRETPHSRYGDSLLENIGDSLISCGVELRAISEVIRTKSLGEIEISDEALLDDCLCRLRNFVACAEAALTTRFICIYQKRPDGLDV
jgi:hypothetical protein